MANEELGPPPVRSAAARFIERLAQYRDADPEQVMTEVVERLAEIEPALEYADELGVTEESRADFERRFQRALIGPIRLAVVQEIEQRLLEQLTPVTDQADTTTEANADGATHGDENGNAEADAEGNGNSNDDADADAQAQEADPAPVFDADAAVEAATDDEVESPIADLIRRAEGIELLGDATFQRRLVRLALVMAFAELHPRIDDPRADDRRPPSPEAIRDQAAEHIAALTRALATDDPLAILPEYGIEAEAVERLGQELAEKLPQRRDSARGVLAGWLNEEMGGRNRVLFHRIGFKRPDLGTSLTGQRDVLMMIGEALPITLLLNILSVPFIYIIAISAGILAARGRGKAFDVVSGMIFIAMWSVPVIWVGTMAIGTLADDPVNLFPTGGLSSIEAENWPLLPFVDADGNWQRGWLLDRLWHLVLPVVCMSYASFAVLCKITRSAMLENLNADFVRTSRAKGVEEGAVLMRHVFRNSLLPLITMFSGMIPGLLTGALIVENIFSIEGMGRLAINAAMEKDREVVMAITLIMGIVVLMAELLRDVCYAIADPRVSYE